MSKTPYILPWVNQLWPPEGDNRVTNMDVVFFSDLEHARTAPPLRNLGETWVQKGYPEVCWPQQWLPEDLGSNVRIFEFRPRAYLPLTRVYLPLTRVLNNHSVEEAALRELDSVAEGSLDDLRWRISSENKDGQGRPLVFVGHGYGGLVLKKALVELHDQLGAQKDLRSNLCGIVFYGGTNTKLTNKHDPMFLENQGWQRRFLKNFLSKLVDLKFGSDALLLELSKRFEAALDLKKVKVCVVKKNKSIMLEIKDYSNLECQLTDVMDRNDICTPTSKDDPSYSTLLEFLQ